LASFCIRCGSKEHTTRDHDEQKISGAAKLSDKPKKLGGAAKSGAKGAAAALSPTALKPAKVQHPKCWDACRRPEGIPDIIDRDRKPLRDRIYHDPAQENWAHRAECECVACTKKATKRRIEAERLSLKARTFTH
jgi:hypothetical protein